MTAISNNFEQLGLLMQSLEFEKNVPTILNTLIKVRNCINEAWKLIETSRGSPQYTLVHMIVLNQMIPKAEQIYSQKMWEIYPHLVKAVSMVNETLKIAV